MLWEKKKEKEKESKAHPKDLRPTQIIWNPNYICKLIMLEYNDRYFGRKTFEYVQVVKD